MALCLHMHYCWLTSLILFAAQLGVVADRSWVDSEPRNDTALVRDYESTNSTDADAEMRRFDSEYEKMMANQTAADNQRAASVDASAQGRLMRLNATAKASKSRHSGKRQQDDEEEFHRIADSNDLQLDGDPDTRMHRGNGASNAKPVRPDGFPSSDSSDGGRNVDSDSENDDVDKSHLKHFDSKHSKELGHVGNGAIYTAPGNVSSQDFKPDFKPLNYSEPGDQGDGSPLNPLFNKSGRKSLPCEPPHALKGICHVPHSGQCELTREGKKRKEKCEFKQTSWGEKKCMPAQLGMNEISDTDWYCFQDEDGGFGGPVDAFDLPYPCVPMFGYGPNGGQIYLATAGTDVPADENMPAVFISKDTQRHFIDMVPPGSWAAQQGFKTGDEILEIDGIKMPRRFDEKIWRERPLKVKILRASMWEARDRAMIIGLEGEYAEKLNKATVTLQEPSGGGKGSCAAWRVILDDNQTTPPYPIPIANLVPVKDDSYSLRKDFGMGDPGQPCNLQRMRALLKEMTLMNEVTYNIFTLYQNIDTGINAGFADDRSGKLLVKDVRPGFWADKQGITKGTEIVRINFEAVTLLSQGNISDIMTHRPLTLVVKQIEVPGKEEYNQYEEAEAEIETWKQKGIPLSATGTNSADAGRCNWASFEDRLIPGKEIKKVETSIRKAAVECENDLNRCAGFYFTSKKGITQDEDYEILFIEAVRDTKPNGIVAKWDGYTAYVPTKCDGEDRPIYETEPGYIVESNGDVFRTDKQDGKGKKKKKTLAGAIATCNEINEKATDVNGQCGGFYMSGKVTHKLGTRSEIKYGRPDFITKTGWTSYTTYRLVDETALPNEIGRRAEAFQFGKYKEGTKKSLHFDQMEAEPFPTDPGSDENMQTLRRNVAAFGEESFRIEDPANPGEGDDLTDATFSDMNKYLAKRRAAMEQTVKEGNYNGFRSTFWNHAHEANRRQKDAEIWLNQLDTVLTWIKQEQNAQAIIKKKEDELAKKMELDATKLGDPDTSVKTIHEAEVSELRKHGIEPGTHGTKSLVGQTTYRDGTLTFGNDGEHKFISFPANPGASSNMPVLIENVEYLLTDAMRVENLGEDKKNQQEEYSEDMRNKTFDQLSTAIGGWRRKMRHWEEDESYSVTFHSSEKTRKRKRSDAAIVWLRSYEIVLSWINQEKAATAQIEQIDKDFKAKPELDKEEESNVDKLLQVQNLLVVEKAADEARAEAESKGEDFNPAEYRTGKTSTEEEQLRARYGLGSPGSEGNTKKLQQIEGLLQQENVVVFVDQAAVGDLGMTYNYEPGGVYVSVTSVKPGGWADSKGIKENARIMNIAGFAVTSLNQLQVKGWLEGSKKPYLLGYYNPEVNGATGGVTQETKASVADTWRMNGIEVSGNSDSINVVDDGFERTALDGFCKPQNCVEGDDETCQVNGYYANIGTCNYWHHMESRTKQKIADYREKCKDFCTNSKDCIGVSIGKLRTSSELRCEIYTPTRPEKKLEKIEWEKIEGGDVHFDISKSDTRNKFAECWRYNRVGKKPELSKANLEPTVVANLGVSGLTLTNDTNHKFWGDVVDVASNSQAYEQGIRKGMRIVQINEHPYTGSDQINVYAAGKGPYTVTYTAVYAKTRFRFNIKQDYRGTRQMDDRPMKVGHSIITWDELWPAGKFEPRLINGRRKIFGINTEFQYDEPGWYAMDFLEPVLESLAGNKLPTLDEQMVDERVKFGFKPMGAASNVDTLTAAIKTITDDMQAIADAAGVAKDYASANLTSKASSDEDTVKKMISSIAILKDDFNEMDEALKTNADTANQAKLYADVTNLGILDSFAQVELKAMEAIKEKEKEEALANRRSSQAEQVHTDDRLLRENAKMVSKKSTQLDVYRNIKRLINDEEAHFKAGGIDPPPCDGEETYGGNEYVAPKPPTSDKPNSGLSSQHLDPELSGPGGKITPSGLPTGPLKFPSDTDPLHPNKPVKPLPLRKPFKHHLRPSAQRPEEFIDERPYEGKPGANGTIGFYGGLKECSEHLRSVLKQAGKAFEDVGRNSIKSVDELRLLHRNQVLLRHGVDDSANLMERFKRHVKGKEKDRIAVLGDMMKDNSMVTLNAKRIAERQAAINRDIENAKAQGKELPASVYDHRDHAAMPWEEIPSDARGHWEQLGWDERSWDRDIILPRTASMKWHQLSTNDKLAAKSLSFTRETWDEKVKNWTQSEMFRQPVYLPRDPNQRLPRDTEPVVAQPHVVDADMSPTMAEKREETPVVHDAVPDEHEHLTSEEDVDDLEEDVE